MIRSVSEKQAKNLVVKSESHVSMVLVRKQHRWNDEELARIQKEALGTCMEIQPDPKKRWNMLRIPLPKEQAFSALPSPAHMTAVEVTLELETETADAANELWAFIAQHLEWDTGPRYEFDRHVMFGVEQDRNGARLSMRPAAKGRCIKGPGCIVTYYEQGFFAPSELEGMKKFDHCRFWALHLKLRHLPDAMAIGQLTRRLANPRRTVLVAGVEEQLKELGELLLAASRTNGRVHVSRLLNFLQATEKDGAGQMDADWLFPPSVNALWRQS